MTQVQPGLAQVRPSFDPGLATGLLRFGPGLTGCDHSLVHVSPELDKPRLDPGLTKVRPRFDPGLTQV